MKIKHNTTPELESRKALKADTILQNLKGKTPQQISTWVDNNINNLDDAKMMFKLMLYAFQTLKIGE